MATRAARVLSVNVGTVREFEYNGRRAKSAIWKSPVAGRIAARGVNLDGDAQADRKAHGGPDKRSTHTPSKTHGGGNRRSADRLHTRSAAKISRPTGLRGTMRSSESVGRLEPLFLRFLSRESLAGGLEFG